MFTAASSVGRGFKGRACEQRRGGELNIILVQIFRPGQVQSLFILTDCHFKSVKKPFLSLKNENRSELYQVTLSISLFYFTFNFNLPTLNIKGKQNSEIQKKHDRQLRKRLWIFPLRMQQDKEQIAIHFWLQVSPTCVPRALHSWKQRVSVQSAH